MLKSSRSIRGYDESYKVNREEPAKLVDYVRYTPSNMNMQPLRYRLVFKPDEVIKLQSLTKWAGVPKGLHLPHEGRCSPVFVVVCHDMQIAAADPGFVRNMGIVCQTITPSTWMVGLSGRILGASSIDTTKEMLGLSTRIIPMLIAAVGKPEETIALTETEKGESVTYYHDENDVYYVPKHKLEDVLIWS